MEKQSAEKLKKKLKELQNSNVGLEKDRIRLHRAISWIKCASEFEDIDIKFISLWISFNACYANEGEHDLTEKEQFRDFIKKLVNHDQENLFFTILWDKFSGSVITLIANKYAYKKFWLAQIDTSINWNSSYKKRIHSAHNFFSNRDVSELLLIVLDQLYTVRNQLIHGGSTYKSKVNRTQVNDSANILEFLMPVIIKIMLENITDDWGEICYPIVSKTSND
jgi:hypothetical protein